MCTNPQTENGHPVPESWHELASRISSARAVAAYILEAIPYPRDPDMRKAADCATGLACAVIDLLEMCAKDCERLETELKNPNP